MLSDKILFVQAQEFLEDLLHHSAEYQLSDANKKAIDHDGIESFIYQQLTRKKFRKYSLLGACVARTQQAIAHRVSSNQPITVVYPQGGYKLWRLPSSPTADWAEFFNIAYLLAYLAPVTKAYQPGVKLVYYLHTLLMERHGNLATTEITQYVESFQQLLNEFKKYLPQNITLNILRDADIYPRPEYFHQLEQGRVEAEKQYLSLPADKIESMKKQALLNIKWQGAEDWSGLSEAEREEKLRLAAIYEMAAVSHLPKVTQIVKSPENVLVFTKASPEFIGIGSCKASIVKHWVGFGVLQKRGTSFLPLILSPSQRLTYQKLPHRSQKIGLVSQDNFHQISIY